MSNKLKEDDNSLGIHCFNLYNACNDKYNLQVTEYICDLYSHWQRCRYMNHMSEYYNVRLHKFIWINGRH